MVLQSMIFNKVELYQHPVKTAYVYQVLKIGG
jgi:hypothetical protein